MADLFDIAVARKLSGGGGGGAEPLIVTYNEGTLDKTWQEIYDALGSAQPAYIAFSAAWRNSLTPIISASNDGVDFIVSAIDTGSGSGESAITMVFVATSADSYPAD